MLITGLMTPDLELTSQRISQVWFFAKNPQVQAKNLQVQAENLQVQAVAEGSRSQQSGSSCISV